MANHPPKIRLATESDVPALLPLVLTLFLQLPLFSYLHSPLHTNLDLAHDTLWLWKRRLSIGIADPCTVVVLAEAEHGEGKSESVSIEQRKVQQWLERNGYMVKNEGWGDIVGFAIWEVRLGREVRENERLGELSATDEEQERLSNVLDEINARNATAPRRDQDPTRMEAFREAEKALHEKFYSFLAHPTLYLDNIVVSHLHQRRGVGKALMNAGISFASSREIDIWTEASPMGLALYSGLGFEDVGNFEVKVEGDEGEVSMPVMVLRYRERA